MGGFVVVSLSAVVCGCCVDCELVVCLRWFVCLLSVCRDGFV